VKPYVEGGLPTVGNIQLRCRAHNVYEWEQRSREVRRLEDEWYSREISRGAEWIRGELAPERAREIERPWWERDLDSTLTAATDRQIERSAARRLRERDQTGSDPRAWSSTAASERSSSATLQAWAMQPRGLCGGSASKISLTLPTPASFR
jgi:hypothetical protein